MSFVSTQPTELTAAAENLQGIGSSLATQNVAAAAPTTGVLPAAADEVSALTAPSSRPMPRCIRPSARRRQRSTKCSSTHSAPAQAPTLPPRRPTQSRPAEADSHAGLWRLAAGDQLRTYVRRPRAGLDAGSRGSLAVGGRGADLRSVRVRLRCLNPHQRV